MLKHAHMIIAPRPKEARNEPLPSHSIKSEETEFQIADENTQQYDPDIVDVRKLCRDAGDVDCTLEGFHQHQKQWLGSLSKHHPDAGAALSADGTIRWNRKRRREDDVCASETSL